MTEKESGVQTTGFDNAHLQGCIFPCYSTTAVLEAS